MNLAERARNLRRHALRMAERVGQGYVGQALGIADLLAVLYFHEMKDDRFVLSIGHYSIALYAALAEKGVIPMEELDTYGVDGSRLPMSGDDRCPGFEITGGSLGQGLSQAVGLALGMRMDRHPGRVFALISDGELQEGAIWEAAMAAAHYRLDRLFVFIDCNDQQADGPPARVMGVEPVRDKWAAFGWDARRVNGNSIDDLLRAIGSAGDGRPRAIVLDTQMGKGVPLFETREKNHFIRVEPHEWALAKEQLG
ncbi:MAG TPA: transketolase [Planctomycetota bacterium]